MSNGWTKAYKNVAKKSIPSITSFRTGVELNLNNISHTYNENSQKVNVLNNVNLKIFPGEMVALTGPSGTGKSTLLKIFSGSVDCETGNIVIPNGINVGYLPQEKVITSKLSVIDEAMLVFGFINDYKNDNVRFR